MFVLYRCLQRTMRAKCVFLHRTKLRFFVRALDVQYSTLNVHMCVCVWTYLLLFLNRFIFRTVFEDNWWSFSWISTREKSYTHSPNVTSRISRFLPFFKVVFVTLALRTLGKRMRAYFALLSTFTFLWKQMLKLYSHRNWIRFFFFFFCTRSTTHTDENCVATLR